MDNDQIIRTIASVYMGVDGWKISRDSIAKLSSFYRGMKYDEASTASFLDAFFVTQPQKDDIFLDLGSGLGKKVFASALTETVSKCVGIELLEGLYTAANAVKDTLRKDLIVRTDTVFIHGDYYNIDFSYVSIVHISISPIMIYFQLNGTLGYKLKQLKKGTRVIISEVPIPFAEFSLIKTIEYVFPSRIEKAYIYEKIR